MTKKLTSPPTTKPLTRHAAPMLAAAGLMLTASGCVGVYAGEPVGVQAIPDAGEPGTDGDAGVPGDAGQAET